MENSDGWIMSTISPKSGKMSMNGIAVQEESPSAMNPLNNS